MSRVTRNFNLNDDADKLTSKVLQAFAESEKLIHRGQRKYPDKQLKYRWTFNLKGGWKVSRSGDPEKRLVSKFTNDVNYANLVQGPGQDPQHAARWPNTTNTADQRYGLKVLDIFSDFIGR